MTYQQTINPWYLTTLLDPLGGLADDDDAVERFRSFDPNNEVAVRALVDELIVPYLRQFTDESIARIKLTMRCYLSSPDFARWGAIFDSVLPPFDHPRDPRNFFLCIWQQWFPNEDYKLENLSGYIIVSNLNESNRALRRKSR